MSLLMTEYDGKPAGLGDSDVQRHRAMHVTPKALNLQLGYWGKAKGFGIGST